MTLLIACWVAGAFLGTWEDLGSFETDNLPPRIPECDGSAMGEDW
jgi:hypothetical protein